MQTKQSIYRFGKTPISYSLKSEEYSYPEGHYCLEQTYYTPGKPDFTDVQRCLKCNGNNEGVSTWGPWTAASHWAIEPVYGYDVYSVTLSDIESITYLIDNYTGSSRIYNGGFIVVAAGENIMPESIVSTKEEEITVTIDNNKKNIGVTAGTVSSIENIEHNSKATIIYDLAGRRLYEMTRPGIYIVNGKKYIRK